MPIEIMDLGLNILAYRVDGKVRKQDIQRVFQEVDVRVATGEKMRVYAEVVSIPAMSVAGILKEIKGSVQRLDAMHLVEKAALVTDSNLLRMAARVEDKVLQGVHVRVFALADQVEAQTWVRT